jgi:mannitol-1-phosphate/altronate dehydrogenase
LTLGVAGWCYALSEDFFFEDILRDRLLAAAKKAVTTRGKAFLEAIPEVFSSALRNSQDFTALFEKSLKLIIENGPAKAIELTMLNHYS